MIRRLQVWNKHFWNSRNFVYSLYNFHGHRMANSIRLLASMPTMKWLYVLGYLRPIAPSTLSWQCCSKFLGYQSLPTDLINFFWVIQYFSNLQIPKGTARTVITVAWIDGSCVTKVCSSTTKQLHQRCNWQLNGRPGHAAHFRRWNSSNFVNQLL